MQAARGTSLNAEPSPAEASPGGEPSRAAGIGPLFVVGVVVALAIDQGTKILAVERLRGADPIPLIGDLLSLTFLRNPGAAFGFGASMTVVLSLLAVGVAVVVVRLASQLRDRAWAVALGLLLAGAVGNLIDRIFREPGFLRGHVVDFINYNGYFVGNVADIYLTVAAILIVVRTLQGVGLDGTKEADARA